MAKPTSENASRETAAGPALTADEEGKEELAPSYIQRPITVYDAVAGRAGLNGFLTQEQRDSDQFLPIAPEEVLLRRTTVPENTIYDNYDAAGQLSGLNKLPESEMLKAIHTYAADFYSTAVEDQGRVDFRSLDETALVAVGILLEEAVREAVGENGDMVFVEPEGLEGGLEESKMTQYQVKGRVKRGSSPQSDLDEDSLKEDESPAKKQKTSR